MIEIKTEIVNLNDNDHLFVVHMRKIDGEWFNIATNLSFVRNADDLLICLKNSLYGLFCEVFPEFKLLGLEKDLQSIEYEKQRCLRSIEFEKSEVKLRTELPKCPT